MPLVMYNVKQEEVGQPIKSLRVWNIAPIVLEGNAQVVSPDEIAKQSTFPLVPIWEAREVKRTVKPKYDDVKVYKYKIGNKYAPMIVVYLNKLMNYDDTKKVTVNGAVDDNVYELMRDIAFMLNTYPAECKTVYPKLNIRGLKLAGVSLDKFYKALPAMLLYGTFPDVSDVVNNENGSIVFVFATDYSPLKGEAVFDVTACPLPENLLDKPEELSEIVDRITDAVNMYYK